MQHMLKRAKIKVGRGAFITSICSTTAVDHMDLSPDDDMKYIPSKTETAVRRLAISKHPFHMHTHTHIQRKRERGGETHTHAHAHRHARAHTKTLRGRNTHTRACVYTLFGGERRWSARTGTGVCMGIRRADRDGAV